MLSINVNDPASILAAIPAVLGFSPQSSIVALLIVNRGGNPELQNLLRMDIDREHARILTTAHSAVFRNVSAAVLVAIADTDHTGDALDALDILRDSFTDLGIATRARLLAPALDDHGTWTDIDRGDSGPITPFGRTAFAAESVYRGRRVADTRDDIAAEFTPKPNPAPILRDDPTDSVQDTFEILTAVITGTEPAHHHPDLASRMAVLLTDVHLRDVAIGISLDHAAPAAALWTRLANQLTGQPRLELLAIAASAYYAGYDAVRAGIALDIAADEAAAHKLTYPRLAALLRASLDGGISPEKVAAALAAAARRAP
jgi:hypothetical protein